MRLGRHRGWLGWRGAHKAALRSACSATKEKPFQLARLAAVLESLNALWRTNTTTLLEHRHCANASANHVRGVLRLHLLLLKVLLILRVVERRKAGRSTAGLSGSVVALPGERTHCVLGDIQLILVGVRAGDVLAGCNLGGVDLGCVQSGDQGRGDFVHGVVGRVSDHGDADGRSVRASAQDHHVEGPAVPVGSGGDFGHGRIVEPGQAVAVELGSSGL